jgi:membrane protease YdiL (CAAX protease family)
MVRAEALLMANLLLVAMGAAVLLVPLLRRRWIENPPEPSPPPWSLADGIGVLIRGDFWGRLYLVLLGGSSYEFQSSALGTLLFEWSTLLAAIPLLWLSWHYLVRPLRVEGRGPPDPFGLHPRRWAHAWAAGIALAAIAAELLGTGILGWSSLLVGVEGGWAEGFDETLAFGSLSEVLLTSFDYIIMAPIVEELAFRGILYFSLRRRLGPWQAAAASAAIFSFVHFYSLPGFLTTFWSGAIWAVAFERTRSLVPGIAAHAVYNLLYVASWTLIYR